MPLPLSAQISGDTACSRAGTPLGALSTPGVHEFYALSGADAVSTHGFALGVMLSGRPGAGLVWVVHDLTGMETGRPHGAGLQEMGIQPQDLLLVRARNIATLLGVGEDALRTPGVEAVLLSAWGEDRALNLTAGRRLGLLARSGNKRLFLSRAAAAPRASPAESRWSIQSAASTPLMAGAPGRPAFSATLLRHRRGAPLRTWTMEWDREARSFVEPAPISGRLAALATQRPAAGPTGLRRTG